MPLQLKTYKVPRSWRCTGCSRVGDVLGAPEVGDLLGASAVEDLLFASELETY